MSTNEYVKKIMAISLLSLFFFYSSFIFLNSTEEYSSFLDLASPRILQIKSRSLDMFFQKLNIEKKFQKVAGVLLSFLSLLSFPLYLSLSLVCI
ncbi:hypothetical protein O6P43_020788 [Quillaja saponaria]|uniref:Uncharacterized protein n=1 Tax=Quillaja saponaria TaxID=32244 RepID=A0AAD7PLT8_QUISA|nr:hypothetical protein O6P43_020788 [Quillaja saponaria]